MPHKVLLVDDSDRIRKSVRAYLEKEFGFHVCGELVDVRDAIEKVRDLKPDLVVCEVSIDIEAIQQLKRLLPHIPIILFTAYGPLLQGFYPAEIGVDAVVAKDFGVSSLGKAVTSLFARSWPGATRIRPSGKL
jgi:DNA-binding NarL/FixJ family response regulator